MDVRRCLLRRPAHVYVVVPVEARVNSTLKTHFGASKLPSLANTAGHVVERQQVRLPTQVQRRRTLREAAEATLEGAHVRVVDVAVADVRHVASDSSPAQLVGDLGNHGDLRPTGTQQGDDLVLTELLASARTREHFLDCAAGPGPTRDQSQRAASAARVPGRRPAADENNLCARPDVLRVGVALGQHGSGIVAAEHLRIRPVEDREHHRLVEPAGALGRVLRVDRETRREHLAGRFGDRLQPLDRRPGSLRIDVVGGDRGDAPPVVDARLQQRAEVVREVRRRLQVHLVGQNQAS